MWKIEIEGWWIVMIGRIEKVGERERIVWIGGWRWNIVGDD